MYTTQGQYEHFSEKEQIELQKQQAIILEMRKEIEMEGARLDQKILEEEAKLPPPTDPTEDQSPDNLVLIRLRMQRKKLDASIANVDAQLVELERNQARIDRRAAEDAVKKEAYAAVTPFS